MNDGLTKLALFTRDLMAYDEQLIRIGRKGYTREDFEADYIVVDSIGPAQAIATGERYNGDTEDQLLSTLMQAPCTLNFYGDGAYQNATRFMLLTRSQAAYDLQSERNITVFNVSQLTDVKALTGQQYGENIELSLFIQYNETIDLSVLRIDTLQWDAINDTTGAFIPPSALTPWIDAEPWIDSEAWTD